MSPSPQEFLEALRAAVRSRGDAERLAGRVDGDGDGDGDAVMVLLRQDALRGAGVSPGPIQGVRLRFAALAVEVLGPGTHASAAVLREAVLEILEPHGPGEPWT